MYDYEAQDGDEVSFRDGDIIGTPFHTPTTTSIVQVKEVQWIGIVSVPVRTRIQLLFLPIKIRSGSYPKFYTSWRKFHFWGKGWPVLQVNGDLLFSVLPLAFVKPSWVVLVEMRYFPPANIFWWIPKYRFISRIYPRAILTYRPYKQIGSILQGCEFVIGFLDLDPQFWTMDPVPSKIQRNFRKNWIILNIVFNDFLPIWIFQLRWNVQVGSGSGRIRNSGVQICGSGSQRNIYGFITLLLDLHLHQLRFNLTPLSSVVDPYPDPSQWGPWIRNRIQKGKNDPQK